MSNVRRVVVSKTASGEPGTPPPVVVVPLREPPPPPNPLPFRSRRSGRPSATFTLNGRPPRACPSKHNARCSEGRSSNSRKYPRGRSVSRFRTMRTSAMAHAFAAKSPTTSSWEHSYGKFPTNAVNGGAVGIGRVGRGGCARSWYPGGDPKCPAGGCSGWFPWLAKPPGGDPKFGVADPKFGWLPLMGAPTAPKGAPTPTTGRAPTGPPGAPNPAGPRETVCPAIPSPCPGAPQLPPPPFPGCCCPPGDPNA